MPIVSTDDLRGPVAPRRASVSAERVRRRQLKTSTEILANATRNALRGAVLGYSIRSGLLFLLRLMRVVKGKLPISKALLESLFGKESFRMAGFFGVFAFVWKATNNAIIRHRDGKDDHVNGFISGALAGALASLVETKQWRTDMSQQFLARGLQALFNSLSLNGHFHFRHGNSLIFALATAQVMYAYTMRPETIPPSYNKFIVTTGPIPLDVLLIVRQQLTGKIPLDPAAVIKAVVNNKGSQHCIEVASAISPMAECIPCEVLHPAIEGCNRQSFFTLMKVLKAILPVYFTLNFVPMVVLKTRELFRRPQSLLWRGVKNSMRSSLFLAAYVASFMRIACFTRDIIIKHKILPRDSRYFYWLNGFLSSWAIFLEDEKRRSELAMYVLPRGVDALYKTLYSKSLIFQIPHFEVAMFSAGLGLIICYFQTEPEALGGIISRLLRRVDLTIEDADMILKPEHGYDSKVGKDVDGGRESGGFREIEGKTGKLE
ncbi:hypothetical protein HDU80_010309 [Chytriomyces hyalinus]|nr:hypothetical protein HDU80_010309 [Chytriomyces hyalinus]